MKDVRVDENLQDLIGQEREFLHEVANQLMIVHGMGSILLKNFSKLEISDEKLASRLEKLVQASEKATDLIKQRRKNLITMGQE